MPTSQSLKFIKRLSLSEESYYDITGRIEIMRRRDKSVDHLRILDKDTGERIGIMDAAYASDFIPYEGKVIKFRGYTVRGAPGIIPHIKKS